MLSVGAILEGAFRLVRERPGAVAIWCLIEAVATAAVSMAMRPMYRMQAASVSLDHPATGFNFGAIMGSMLLAELLAIIVFTILMAAAFRAVLRPRQGGTAFLAFGRDELRLIGLTLLFAVALYMGLIVVGVVSVVVAALLTRAAGLGVMTIAFGVGLAMALSVAVWLEVRLSLAFPLTLLRGRIAIGESWRLTRGRFWTLFGAFLVVFLLLLVLFAAFAAVSQATYWGEVMRNGFGSESVRAASARQAATQLTISSITVVGWIVSGIAGGLTVALFGGAAATAARLLTDDTDRIAETFA